MPLLSPITPMEIANVESEPEIVKNLKPLQIEKILQKEIPQLAQTNEYSAKLEEFGAGVDKTLMCVANIMNFGVPDDAIRLRAAETNMKIHGILRDEKQAYQFNFVIQGDDVNVNQILKPQR